MAVGRGPEVRERQGRANAHGHRTCAMMTRRELLALLAFYARARPVGQGVSSRGVKPQPRGKPSGRPFQARFTDVAQAGRSDGSPSCTAVPTARATSSKSSGCGIAFLDYDNDGWLDLFVLSGTRLDGPPANATNRLYKNNRDGTFTDVTAKAGLTRTGWASAVTVGDYDNDGFDDLFITYYGQNVLYHNNGDGTFTDVTEKAGLRQQGDPLRLGLHVGRLRPRRPPRSVCGQVSEYHDENSCRSRERTPIALERRSGELRAAGLPPGSVQLFHNNGDGTFTDVSRQSGVAAAARSLSDDGCRRRLR